MNQRGEGVVQKEGGDAMAEKALIGFGERLGVVDVRYLSNKSKEMKASVVEAFYKVVPTEAIVKMASEGGIALLQADDPSQSAEARASELKGQGYSVFIRDLAEVRDMMRDAGC